ncbi:MAG TPA: ABC transporter permease [Planctomycetota bacterium]|nr:ABC transporter permease [Planctomycetota bacterium]
MLAYASRRLLLGLITLLLVSFVVYGLIRAMPGDPVTQELALADDGFMVTRIEYEQMRRAFGLDKHWVAAYFEWLGKTASGDLGRSLQWRLPVSSLIRGALGPTLLLSGVSLLLAYVLSIPLGLYAAHRSGKPDERALSAFLYMLYSFPSYVVAIFLLMIFGVQLGLLPLSGLRSPGHENLSTAGRVWDVLTHMALPVTCYTYGTLAYQARFIRSSLAEVMRQDFIRTARAKGLSERTVLLRHAFPNTLIPFITMLGLSLPALLGGSVILERIFSWPGIGDLFLSAIGGRDYPLIMGLTMMFSVLIILGTLLADLLYALVDPRVSYT